MSEISRTFNPAPASRVRLMSIAITAPPAKTAYKAGEAFDAAGMVVTAAYSNGAALAVGGYTVTPEILQADTTAVTIRYTEGGVTRTATQAVSVTKTGVAIPTYNENRTYDGTEQTPNFINDPGSAIATKSGDTTGLNAGSYTCRFTLVDTALYQWADGSIAPKDVGWGIEKATPTLSVSPESLTLDPDHLTASATITTNGDGALTARSSDSTVATAAISGKTVTVSHVNKTTGAATITVSQAEGTNYKAAYVTLNVTASFISNNLSDNDWSVISMVSQAGNGDTYWDVGDAYPITLDGKIGDAVTLSNQTLYVFILDFNHADNGVPDNNIIWGGFRTRYGVDVALTDPNYNGNCRDGTKLFNMNHWGQNSGQDVTTNYGGWKGCDLRYDILGGTSTPPSGYGSAPTTSRVGYDATEETIKSPVSGTVMAALPPDFRSVLRLRRHYVDNRGNAGSYSNANVTSVIDAISLPTEFEIMGERFYANEYEKNYQTQFAFYANGNSKLKKKHFNVNESAFWHLASPTKTNVHCFCDIGISDNSAPSGASGCHGISPVFKT